MKKRKLSALMLSIILAAASVGFAAAAEKTATDTISAGQSAAKDVIDKTAQTVGDLIDSLWPTGTAADQNASTSWTSSKLKAAKVGFTKVASAAMISCGFRGSRFPAWTAIRSTGRLPSPESMRRLRR